MSKPGKKRSRGAPATELVQATVPAGVKRALRERAAAEMISEAAYVRRLICRDLGFLPQEDTNG